MIFRRLHFKKPSGLVAKNRLEILLITDRVNCNMDTLSSIEKEIINVISKYIDIDKEQSRIEIKQEGTPYLSAYLPIKEVKI